MRKKRISKTKLAGIVTDCVMFLCLVLQMLFVFTGNIVHEWLGIVFFACLLAHMILKRKWIAGALRNLRNNRAPGMILFEAVTVLLLLCVLALMVSAMDVSRVLFPEILIFGSADLHRYLATAVLALSVLHAGLSIRRRSEHKRRVTAAVLLLTALSVAAGAFLVPYLNRHFRKVEIGYAQAVSGEKLALAGKKPLTVYFTRLGNTDFAQDVDAVSGASLLLADGRLTGSCELLADMTRDILENEVRPIRLTGEKYPSSYSGTVADAQRELREDARPAVEQIDISGYDEIILIYPLWWNTIPMPVASFLESADFSGKTVFLIATQGSRGFGSSVRAVRDLIPGADVRGGISIYCDDIPHARAELFDYLREALRREDASAKN